MPSLRWRIWGKQAGNFRSKQVGTQSVASALEICGRHAGLETIFIPKCSFTNRIVTLGQEDERLSSYVITTRDNADGGIVERPKRAVAILNADCPIAAIYDKKRERLAVLHAGFRCLMDSKRDQRSQQSIIEAVFHRHSFAPSSVEVFTGFGIGPCCYGAEHYPELDNLCNSLSTSRATKGPRAGQRSINFSALIKQQLMRLGVSEDCITQDIACTACDGLYYSNCVDGSEAGRNAALAWYE